MNEDHLARARELLASLDQQGLTHSGGADASVRATAALGHAVLALVDELSTVADEVHDVANQVNLVHSKR